MGRIQLVVLTLLGLAALTLPALAQHHERDTSPELRLLKRMMQAEMGLSYSGSRVVTDNVEGRADRHVETVLRSGARTRVEFPKGSSRHGEVVAEKDGRRQHWVPKQNTVFTGRARRAQRYAEQMPRLIDGIREGHLTLRTIGSTRVAGRAATSLELRRADGEPVWRMAIDDATGILLKQEIFDRANPRRVIGSFEYTQITVNAKVSDEDFVIKRPHARQVNDEFIAIDRVQRTVTFHILQPTHLPSGFALVGAKEARFGERVGVHLLYQDRPVIEPLSIFQVEGRMERHHEGDRFRSRGFNSALKQVGTVFATVVGKLSQADLQAVADSLR